MTKRPDRLILFASVTALGLTLAQSAIAETESTATEPADDTTQASTETAAPDPRSAAQARAEQWRAQTNAERERRYQELRERAAEVGLDLPEAPPWSHESPPAMPGWAGRGMPAMQRDAVRDEHYAALRERAAGEGIELPETPPWRLTTDAERRAYHAFVRDLTADQRRTLNRLRWEETRSRAAQRGYELPASPPWEAVEQRREAMRKRWETYRETVEAMTDEQREAAAAIFGAAPYPFDSEPGVPAFERGGPAFAPGWPEFGPRDGWGPGPKGSYWGPAYPPAWPGDAEPVPYGAPPAWSGPAPMMPVPEADD
ncbi:hypothetical protein ABC977_00610 [Thioalkalicoccus limnaeus]|uniref:DUF3106 domain-containing protein n=1 Tax=Thioalkalicoccus limnaeus TaxID=120681 RepID=A0ABV4B990_9GAMM